MVPVSSVRIAAAFILSVFITIFLIPTIHCATLVMGIKSLGSCSKSVNGYMFYGMFLGLPPALIFGVPLYLIFRKKAWLAWWQVILGGCLAGIIFGVALAILDGTFRFGAALLFGGMGAFCAAVFWLIGLWRH